MKMKKMIALTAALGMTVGTITLSACGKGETAKDVDYTITIVDQDGDVVEGVAFELLQNETTVATLETDENGVASGTLKEGTYTINYAELPSDFYTVEFAARSLSLSVEDASVTLTVENYTLGTSLSPFTCYYEILDEETGETSDSMYVPTVLAHSDNHYLVSKAGDRIICVEQADVTIIYKGVSYSAKDGYIEIQSQAPTAGDLNYWAPLQIINDTDSDIELTMTFREVVVEEGDEIVE